MPIKANEYGEDWLLQSQRARERDNFTCRICETTENVLGRKLDVHHRVAFKSFKTSREANVLENLISYCPKCHNSVEPRKAPPTTEQSIYFPDGIELPDFDTKIYEFLS